MFLLRFYRQILKGRKISPTGMIGLRRFACVVVVMVMMILQNTHARGLVLCTFPDSYDWCSTGEQIPISK
jgi:hypothetical protein